MYALLAAGQPLLESRYGIFVPMTLPGRFELAVLGSIVLAALLLGLVPAFRAYRNTLTDGLQVRI
jgi:putative ABC transport system permease protein